MNILLTGGIGDILCIESFMSQSERDSITSIYYATRAYKIGIELFDSIKEYFPNLINQIPLWTEFNHNLSCFVNLYNLLQFSQNNKLLNLIPSDLVDYSIMPKFPEYRTTKPICNSSFLKKKLISIEKFNLNYPYIVIFPVTNQHAKTTVYRNFNTQDWNNIFNYLSKNNLKGVVLHIGDEEIPKSDLLISLSNQTSVVETIEILKLSKGYLGVDSYLTVLASKIFTKHLWVKSIEDQGIIGRHLNNWKDLYFSPKTSIDFVNSNLMEI